MSVNAKDLICPPPVHPLDPLSPAEIQAAVHAIKAKVKDTESGEHKVWFKSIALVEPPKKLLAPWLDQWHNAGRGHRNVLPRLPRRAMSLLGIKRPTSTTWYGE